MWETIAVATMGWLRRLAGRRGGMTSPWRATASVLLQLRQRFCRPLMCFSNFSRLNPGALLRSVFARSMIWPKSAKR